MSDDFSKSQVLFALYRRTEYLYCLDNSMTTLSFGLLYGVCRNAATGNDFMNALEICYIFPAFKGCFSGEGCFTGEGCFSGEGCLLQRTENQKTFVFFFSELKIPNILTYLYTCTEIVIQRIFTSLEI